MNFEVNLFAGRSQLQTQKLAIAEYMFKVSLLLRWSCLHLLLLKPVGERRDLGSGIDSEIIDVIVTCFAGRFLKKREDMPEEVGMLIT